MEVWKEILLKVIIRLAGTDCNYIVILLYKY